MLCPECSQTLHDYEITIANNQKVIVYECMNCGGHFVPPLISNLIPKSTAKDIDTINPRKLSPSKTSITCPICKENMSGISDDVVPRNVTIYSCPENHGNYFPLHQLVAFKKAQKSKIEYHQIWGIPLKSAFSVLLPVLVVLTAISALPFTLNELRSSQESRVKASELLSTPLISPISPNQVIISFTTKNPTSVQLILQSSEGSSTYSEPVGTRTTHIFDLSNLTPATTYTYQITLDNKKLGQFTFTTPGY